MNWNFDVSGSSVILFAAFFLLYGLEFIIPLVRKRSGHFLANISFAVVLVTINVLFTSFTFLLANWVETNKIGLFYLVTLPVAWKVLVSIIFLDFWSGYVVHYLFHRYAWLWKLHSVHHSDELVDVTTTFRQHPAESVICIIFNLSGVVILGIPLWILAIYITLSTIQSQLEHANIRLPDKLDRLLQYVIVTPNMHKVHHSRTQPETDSNYGNIFSLWDRLFGTFRLLHDYQSIDYGLDYLRFERSASFWELLRLPFKRYRKNE